MTDSAKNMEKTGRIINDVASDKDDDLDLEDMTEEELEKLLKVNSLFVRYP